MSQELRRILGMDWERQARQAFALQCGIEDEAKVLLLEDLRKQMPRTSEGETGAARTLLLRLAMTVGLAMPTDAHVKMARINHAIRELTAANRLNVAPALMTYTDNLAYERGQALKAIESGQPYLFSDFQSRVDYVEAQIALRSVGAGSPSVDAVKLSLEAEHRLSILREKRILMCSQRIIEGGGVSASEALSEAISAMKMDDAKERAGVQQQLDQSGDLGQSYSAKMDAIQRMHAAKADAIVKTHGVAFDAAQYMASTSIEGRAQVFRDEVTAVGIESAVAQVTPGVASVWASEDARNMSAIKDSVLRLISREVMAENGGTLPEYRLSLAASHPELFNEIETHIEASGAVDRHYVRQELFTRGMSMIEQAFSYEGADFTAPKTKFPGMR